MSVEMLKTLPLLPVPGYTKRRPEELAVLTRWFRSADVAVPEAKMLDIILYSREQLVGVDVFVILERKCGTIPRF